MKGLLIWMFQRPLAAWGSWILGPLEDHTKEHGHTLELITVMMIIPFIMCATQLWIQDSFLQSKKRGKGLHRFDEDALAATGREYRPDQPAPEPIFLIADAMWGPDSHRFGDRQEQMTLSVPIPVPENPVEMDSDTYVMFPFTLVLLFRLNNVSQNKDKSNKQTIGNTTMFDTRRAPVNFCQYFFSSLFVQYKLTCGTPSELLVLKRESIVILRSNYQTAIRKFSKNDTTAILSECGGR